MNENQTQTNQSMEALAAQMLLKFGFELTLIILKNINGITTIQQAIDALENIKTAQEYIDADAAARGVPAVPLPVKPAP